MRNRMHAPIVPIVGGVCVAAVLLGATHAEKQYRDMHNAGLGKTIFEERCAPCHGESGRGDGANAFFLNPKPRDFTTGTYKIRTTESGSIPTDDDIRRSITLGLPGTGMPPWGKFIHGDSLDALVSFVKAFSSRFVAEKPKPIPVPAQWNVTPSSIAAGKAVYVKLACGDCHGSDGQGANAVSTDFEDDSGNRIRAANLTEPWRFHGGAKSSDVYLRFRTGIDGTPMPSYVGSASDKELRDLADYVVSLGRKPLWEMNAAQAEELMRKERFADSSDPVKRGEYLVNGFGCAHCHSPIDSQGQYFAGMTFAGGQKWTLGPYGTVVSYNLTSDTATGLGGWSDDQIKAVLTKGTRRDGSRMLPFPMPWTSLSELAPSDLDAIVAYLRTITAIRNRIPGPGPEGFFTYLTEKFKMLLLREELVVYVDGGNAGTPGAARKEAKP